MIMNDGAVSLLPLPLIHHPPPPSCVSIRGGGGGLIVGSALGKVDDGSMAPLLLDKHVKHPI